MPLLAGNYIALHNLYDVKILKHYQLYLSIMMLLSIILEFHK